MYARYHQKRAEKYAADQTAREQELAEIRGEVLPTPQVAAPAPQPQPSAQQPQQQRNDQKRR